MSQEAPAKPEAAEAPAEQPKKGGLPVKTIGMVAAMLVLEAVLIVAVFTMMGKPSPVQAVGIEHEEHDAGTELVEIPVLAERFTNGSSGRVWMWDTEIIIKSMKKHAGEPPAAAGAKDDGHGGKDDKKGDAHGDDHGHEPSTTVREELEARKAEIRTGIGTIISSAQHSYFTEPGRETLSRQILEYLRKVFGHDAEGEDRVAEVLIPRCIGMPVDY